MRNSYIRKQKGIILPVVLIFFSFLMLLGVTFVSVGGFQVSQSMSQVDRSQAYYFAKSGAETYAEYLINKSKNYSDVEEFIVAIENEDPITVTLEGFDDEFKEVKPILGLQVDVENYVSKQSITLNSNANINGSESNYSVNLKLASKSSSEKSVFTITKGKKILLENNSYDLGIKNTNNKEKINIDDVVENYNIGEIVSQEDQFDIIEPLKILEINGSTNLSKSVYYNKIIFNNNGHGELNIDLENKSKVIRVNDLIVRGDINLVNVSEDSLLIIYVDNLLLFDKTNTVVNSNKYKNNLVVIYNGVNDIFDNNKIDFSGVLLVPNVDLKLKGNEIHGAIVAKSVELKNSATIEPFEEDYELKLVTDTNEKNAIDLTIDSYSGSR